MFGFESSITRSMVLDRFSQEDIFAWCLKDVVTTGRKYCSPLRDDRHPACYFKYDYNGTLWFCDWGSINNHYNCFQFYEACIGVPHHLVYEHIWNNVDDCAMYAGLSVPKSGKRKANNSKTEIKTLEKDWEEKEIRYWKQYGITVKQLESDSVKPLKAVMIKNGENSYAFTINNMGFSYNEFPEGRKKIYQPYEKRQKWYTNCNANDIGNIKGIPDIGYNLIITKSYKDCRVIRNLGYNCVWFQNEGMCPSADVLTPLLERFDVVHILYDNDTAGINASDKIKGILKKYKEDVYCFHLPEKLLEKGIKDSSDFVKSFSYNELNSFVKVKLESI